MDALDYNTGARSKNYVLYVVELILPYPIPRAHSPTLPLVVLSNITLSSHNNGRCNRISSGSASAAMMMSSAMPRFNALVAVRGEKERGG